MVANASEVEQNVLKELESTLPGRASVRDLGHLFNEGWTLQPLFSGTHFPGVWRQELGKQRFGKHAHLRLLAHEIGFLEAQAEVVTVAGDDP